MSQWRLHTSTQGTEHSNGLQQNKKGSGDGSLLCQFWYQQKKSNRARLVRIGRPLKRLSHGTGVGYVGYLYGCIWYRTEEAPDHANGICVGPTDPREHHRFGDLCYGLQKEPDLDGMRDRRRANLKCSARLCWRMNHLGPTECQYSTQYVGRPENS